MLKKTWILLLNQISTEQHAWLTFARWGYHVTFWVPYTRNFKQKHVASGKGMWTRSYQNPFIVRKVIWKKQTRSGLKCCVFCTQKSRGIPTLIYISGIVGPLGHRSRTGCKLEIRQMTNSSSLFSISFSCCCPHPFIFSGIYFAFCMT